MIPYTTSGPVGVLSRSLIQSDATPRRIAVPSGEAVDDKCFARFELVPAIRVLIKADEINAIVRFG